MKTCIFCNNKAGSREHLFPEWILRRVPSRTIRGDVGRHKNKEFGREFIVKTVCEACNTGWMHKLEDALIPIMGPLVDDRSAFLSVSDQTLIATWALKTAMVLDSATASKALPIFYSDAERFSLRETRTIPKHTIVWLGRSLQSGLAAHSTGTRYHISKSPHPFGIEKTHPGYISTFAVGNLALQVLTLHPPAEYSDGTVLISPNEGAWDEVLIKVWQPDGSKYWPPVLAFHSNIPMLWFNALPNRWKQGRENPIF